MTGPVMAAGADNLPDINEDEPCPWCGYNLRGLREGGRCPECGKPIPPMFPAEADQDPQEPLRKLSEKLGRPLDSVMFVWRALGFATQRAHRAGRRGGTFSAVEFGWCFRDFALEEFDADPAVACERLAAMGLTRSEDLGAIVFGFVAEKMLATQPTDHRSDFDGLFTMETLFS
jgi:uncharacterized repeat protein (TIGR04138 family)